MRLCLDCKTRIDRGSRCATHARAHQLRRGSSGWERQAIAAAVIERDGGCVMPGPHEGRLEVDHVLPLEHGGKTTLGNLRALCHRHHVTRGRATA